MQAGILQRYCAVPKVFENSYAITTRRHCMTDAELRAVPKQGDLLSTARRIRVQRPYSYSCCYQKAMISGRGVTTRWAKRCPEKKLKASNQACGNHSSLIPAARMTLPHLARSLRINSLKASGVPVLVS